MNQDSVDSKQTDPSEHWINFQPMVPELRNQIIELYAQIDQLKGENQRLRKALLLQASREPKMSSKLKNALYE
ncbi:hypothetical protein J2Z69_000483 [Paenibacillus shirakamiensis]|uniref:Uncharacterized protein n=1 Tax=Paenibacillus shirakamiensis TaxID=1265935 RepID=A0ABS4JCK7_9BACL|nr:hypothetical protein [Paenibacillus shirakamiensis]MBP1999464.1 hypothetical protein [Paenibacillus shirakamiensis]